MELLLDLSGVSDIQALLGGIDAKQIGNEIMDMAGPILLNRTRQRYLAQVDPDGRKWVESDAAKRRHELGIGGGTLFNTGTLFHSIQYAARGNSRVFGTDVSYGAKHQNGIGVIKRVFLGFSAQDIVLVRTVAERVVARAIGIGG